MNASFEHITDQEFSRFRTLIERETGIQMPETKRALVVSRLSRRLRQTGATSYSEYYNLVTSERSAERIHMVDAICTNETSFFREPRQFDFLQNEWIPKLRQEAAAGLRTRRLRVWSAGCSTGEEPYSLAMLFHDLLPADEGWDVQIVATDLSTRVLARACDGVWPVARAKDIPHHYLRRYMLRGIRSQAGTMKAGAEVRKLLLFGRLNLMEASYPIDHGLDLIFCRNVLIYFDQVQRLEIVSRLFSHLTGGGLLFLGHAETLNGFGADATAVIPNVYTK